MARSARNADLEHRTSRLKLKSRDDNEPYWVKIAQGVFLGYYRPASTWWARKLVPGTKRYAKAALGTADDYRDANGADVLDYFQAQDKARDIANEHAAGASASAPLGACTVEDAVKSYVEERRADKGDAAALDAEQRLQKHVLPTLGHRAVSDLTLSELKLWRDKLVTRKKDKLTKATANRIMANFKAALNSVFEDENRGIRSDKAWRALKAFEDAQHAREDHFEAADVQKLIDEARKFDVPFANLLAAGFLTGARYGELSACDVRHFDAKKGMLTIPSGKTGARAVTLMADATAFFSTLVEARPRDAPLLPGTAGARWGKSEQHRRIKRALAAAGLPATASFYALRHSYISRSIELDVPLFIIARNCGTSESMIHRHYAKLIAEKERIMLERAAPAFKLTLIPGGKTEAA
jgi:integrase